MAAEMRPEAEPLDNSEVPDNQDVQAAKLPAAPTAERLRPELAPAERRVIEAFDAYCRRQPAASRAEATTPYERHGRALAFNAHRFIGAAVRRSLPSLKAAHRLPPNAALFNPRQIEDNLAYYYQHFGVQRHGKNEETIRAEKAYLEKYSRGLYERTVGGAQNRRTSRYPAYPEIGIALQLEDALRTVGHTVAADSVEALLAAYGKRLHSAFSGLGHTAVY